MREKRPKMKSKLPAYVLVGATIWYADELHTVVVVQTRSLLAVTALDSNSVAAVWLQTRGVMHRRSEVGVAATIANCVDSQTVSGMQTSLAFKYRVSVMHSAGIIFWF